jgi:hypothetical protein
MYSEGTEVFVLGDLNGEMCGPRYTQVKSNARSQELGRVAAWLELTSLSTAANCRGPKYTYSPYDGGPQSLIDHILINNASHDLVKNCAVLDDCALNVSDHLPVIAELNVMPLINNVIDFKPSRFKWQKLSRFAINETYTSLVSATLQDVQNEVLDQSVLVEDYYNVIVDSLGQAACQSIPTASFKPYLKPYWKKGLKLYHNQMTQKRHAWILAGRPRGSEYVSYVNYKESKRVFRLNMRRLHHENEREFYDELDSTSEVDQCKFWSLLNQRRKRKFTPKSQLKVGNHVYRSSEERLGVWTSYFKTLYSAEVIETSNEYYDDKHKENICQNINNILLSYKYESDEIINHSQLFTKEEVKAEMNSLKNGKKGGFDGLTYEHIKYGGNVLAECLANLFNGMYTTEVVPSGMKRGLIVTLYKGSRKYEDDRRNYRGISLLPVLNKLFEKLMLKRLKKWVIAKGIRFPSLNQNAYQENLCSILASFELQECINYNLERQSKVFVCLLDSSSAFDMVWHAGLFYKLHELGVTGKTWRLLYNSYHNMVSNVAQDGKLSTDIKIEQSVRQGSILGPWLYMLYIHDLAETLINSNCVARVGQVPCGAVLQADDIALAALTVSGLKSLVSYCELYSKQWRFLYNPVKSKMLIFGKASRKGNCLNECEVTLYNHVIDKVSNYSHVGITLDISKKNISITNASAKMRGGLMSILGSRINVSSLSCVTAVKLYRTIVLPRGLYGAELWCRLTKADMSKLEIAHRFCLKIIQSFPRRARSVITERMANCHNIEAYIDTKKLLFIGRLCRLNCSALAKKIFIERLYQGRAYVRCSGIVSELTRVVAKYNLHQHMVRFVQSATFPDKKTWKTIVNVVIREYDDQRVSFILQNESLSRFGNVYGNVLTFHPVWLAERSSTGQGKCYRDLAKLNCVLGASPRESRCVYCNKTYDDQLIHYLQSCEKYTATRELYWSLVLNTCSIELSAHLYNLPDDELAAVVLGKRPELPIPDDEASNLLFLGAKSWQLLAHEKELKFYV